MSKSLKSANVNYTRYADDITISSDNDVSGYIGYAEKLLKQSGYSLNKKKTNFFRQADAKWLLDYLLILKSMCREEYAGIFEQPFTQGQSGQGNYMDGSSGR